MCVCVCFSWLPNVVHAVLLLLPSLHIRSVYIAVLQLMVTVSFLYYIQFIFDLEVILQLTCCMKYFYIFTYLVQVLDFKAKVKY